MESAAGVALPVAAAVLVPFASVLGFVSLAERQPATRLGDVLVAVNEVGASVAGLEPRAATGSIALAVFFV